MRRPVERAKKLMNKEVDLLNTLLKKEERYKDDIVAIIGNINMRLDTIKWWMEN